MALIIGIHISGLVTDGLTIAPKSAVVLYLRFCPKELAAYKFLLPTVLNKFIGPTTLDNPFSCMPLKYFTALSKKEGEYNRLAGMRVPDKLDSLEVDVIVPKAFISYSSSEFSFCTTSLKDRAVNTLYLTNKQNGPTSFRIDFSSKKLPPFQFSSSDSPNLVGEWITVEAGATLYISVKFKPTKTGTYVCEAPLYVREYSLEKPYVVFSLEGVFTLTTLYCKESTAYFVPVPLDVPIEVELVVVANNQPDETRLFTKVKDLRDNDLGHLFQISFPQTDVIKYAMENFEIPVVVRFKSSAATSVVGKITFTDGYESHCSVYLCASSDTSILTTYIYELEIRNPKPKSQLITGFNTMNMGLVGNRNIVSKSELLEVTNSNYEEISPVSCNVSTNHADQVKNTYPKFFDSTNELASRRLEIVDVVERWIFEQGLMCVFRINVGDHIAFSQQFQEAVRSRTKNPCFQNIRSIIDLMVRFSGREFTKCCPIPSSIPEDKKGRITYSLKVFNSVIKFLEHLGAFFPHVTPTLLLDWEDYKYYYEQMRAKSPHPDYEVVSLPFLDKETFVQTTVQCWLDLMLQYIKLSLIHQVEIGRDNRKVNVSESVEPLASLRRNMKPTLLVGVDALEATLLNWLNQTFQAKRELWLGANPGLQLPHRTIHNFGSDLEDGVVLTAVTAHYCPYLTHKYFNMSYLHPTEKAQYSHNATVLCLAWSFIRIGLSVTAMDFTQLNPVSMLITVAHLYNILPTYVPQDTIELGACLNSNISRKITLTNPSLQKIGFDYKKIGDSAESFSIAVSGFNERDKVFTIDPGSSAQIILSFTSKSLFKIRATLVLCGQCVAGGYANNIVYTIEGESKELNPTTTLNINCPIFKVSQVKSPITSPFYSEGDFEVWYTASEPKPGNLNIKRVTDLMKSKVPNNFFMDGGIKTIPAFQEGSATLSMSITTYTLLPQEFWLIYMNPTLGDMIIKVRVVPKITEPQQTIQVPVCFDFLLSTSTEKKCTFSICPNVVQIALPCRNLAMWKAIGTMLSYSLKPEEKLFWEKYLDTPIGLKLVKLIADQYDKNTKTGLDFTFKSTVAYNVTCFSNNIDYSPTVVIDDVYSDDTFNFPVHINHGILCPFSMTMKLISLDGKEIRYYKINFVSKPSGQEV